MMNSDHEAELGRVRRAAGRVRLAVGLASAAMLLAVAAVAIAVAALLPEDAVHHPGSWIPFGLAIVAIAAATLVGLAARRLFAANTEPALVPEVERSIGLRRGELAGALELARPAPGGSAALAHLGRDRVAARIAEHEDWELFPETLRQMGRRISFAGLAFVLALGALGVMASRAPARTARAASALGRPWTTAFPPPPPRIRIMPGDTAVLRGDRLPVRAVASLRDSVAIVWQAAGEPIRRLFVAVEPDGSATGSTEPIDAPTTYWVEGDDGSRSASHEVRPLDPLLVTDLSVELRFPSYLGRPAETLGSLVGEIEIPAGTLIRLSGRTNAELRGAALRPGAIETPADAADADAAGAADTGAAGAGAVTEAADAPGVDLAVDGDAFSVDWRPTRDGTWRWDFDPAVELPGIRPPPPFSLRVIPDLRPGIEITYPGRDTAAGVDLRLPLVVDARDDIGLTVVDLETWRISAAGLQSEPRAVPLWEAGSVQDRDTRLVLRPLLRLDVLGLVPGDTLFYVARARDAHPRHGAAMSDTFRVFVPTMSELRRSAAETAADMARGGRELRDDAADLSRAARDAERRSEGGNAEQRPEGAGSDFGNTEEARRVLERGQELDQRLEDMRAEMEELRAGAEESGLADTALREKLEELEELFRQIEETGLGEQLRKLEEALRNLDGARTQQELGEVSSRLKELEAKLDQTLSLMERVAAEQSMKETTETTRQLADEQSALAENFAPTEEWAGRQEDAAAEAEALMERMEALKEQLTKQGADAAADSVGKSMEQLSGATEQMQAAAGSAQDPSAAQNGEAQQAQQAQQGQQGQQGQQQGQQSQGQQQAAQAAGQMSSVSESMQSAAEMLNEDWKQEALEAVGRATGEALDLATEQNALADALESGAAESEDAAGRQAALMQGLDRLLESLSEAGKKTALIDENVGRSASEARRRMQNLGEQLGSREGPSRASAEESRALVESLNDLAGRLMASRSAVENAGSATGMQEALDQMAQMSQSQAGLNRESGGLMLMQQNGQPMGVQLKRLAERQQEIARQLEELAQRPEAAELPGRPELLATEAEEIARGMRSGQLDRQTLQRQEQLFRRLLDAGRSLERDEDPSRRESQAADMSRPGAMPESRGDVEAGPRYPYPDDAALSEVSRSARRLILEYFDRLNADPGRTP